MPTSPKAVTWPYAYKTVAMSCSNTLYTMPINVTSAQYSNVNRDSELALQIFPPLYIYKAVGLYMHLNYTFNTSIIPTQNQILQGIYVRDTPSPYVRAFGSSVENYMPLNLQADGSGNINISLDLSSLLTGENNNIVFLSFPIANGEEYRSSEVGDYVNLWKLDLIYQTTGVRDEK